MHRPPGTALPAQPDYVPRQRRQHGLQATAVETQVVERLRGHAVRRRQRVHRVRMRALLTRHELLVMPNSVHCVNAFSCADRHDHSLSIIPFGGIRPTAWSVSAAARSMLLYLVKRLGDIYFASFRGFFQEGGFRAWGCCGQDREGPLAVEGKLLLGHARQAGRPGDGRRIVSRPAGCGSRIEGQAVPGSLGALAGRRAQVGVDLAGDVTLEAADDFLL